MWRPTEFCLKDWRMDLIGFIVQPGSYKRGSDCLVIYPLWIEWESLNLETGSIFSSQSSQVVSLSLPVSSGLEASPLCLVRASFPCPCDLLTSTSLPQNCWNIFLKHASLKTHITLNLNIWTKHIIYNLTFLTLMEASSSTLVFKTNHTAFSVAQLLGGSTPGIVHLGWAPTCLLVWRSGVTRCS